MRKVIALLATLAVAAGGASAAARDDDDFLAGYVTAVVERELGLTAVSVRVEDGVAHVVLDDLEGEPPETVARVVAHVRGIRRVEVHIADGRAAPGAQPDGGPVVAEAEGRPDADADAVRFGVLPRHEVFDPLLADPREPHFSAVYQSYLDDEELGNVGSANFGETFALLGWKGFDVDWQLGMLGAVFSVFDLDAESQDLVNSDFWVGPTLSLRRGRWSAQLRGYHQSSHLGDEFLLRNRADRVNLSYEGVDLLLSADLHSALRVYAGGGVIVHSEPDLHPLSVQGGFELRSPVAFLDDLVRPVAAFDVQAREQNDWYGDLAAVAGVELFDPDEGGLRLMILGSYFRGNSPNGQFYERRIEYLGVGTHLFF